MTDGEAMLRPFTVPLLTLAYQGKLPPLLTLKEVLALWFPDLARLSREEKAKADAVALWLREAIASEALPSIKAPDTTKVIHAPPGGWPVTTLLEREYDEILYLEARTAPRTHHVTGAAFVRRAELAKSLGKLPVHLLQSLGEPLSLWLGPLASGSASTDGRKGRGAKSPSSKFLACAALAAKNPLAPNGNAMREATALLSSDRGAAAKIAGATSAYLARHLRGEFAGDSAAHTKPTKKRV